jgi:hypothetical protein
MVLVVDTMIRAADTMTAADTTITKVVPLKCTAEEMIADIVDREFALQVDLFVKANGSCMVYKDLDRS